MRLHNQDAVGSTSISNTFIDCYMPTANGDYVKVYLYVLRALQSGTTTLSIASISDCLDFTEGDVIRALRYWEKQSLLQLTTNAEQVITDLVLLPPHKPAEAQTLQKKATTFSPTTMQNTMAQPPFDDHSQRLQTMSQKTYTNQELLAFQQNEEYCGMLKILEGYFARPMTPQDIQVATFIYQDLHFSLELIYHLYEYCINQGKRKPNYIATVAMNWAEQNITTPDQASQASQVYNRDYRAVSKAFGIQRPLAPAETDYIQVWVKRWGFDEKLIVEACNRTMIKAKGPSFPFANSILERWHKANVHTLDDVAKEDAKYHNEKKEKMDDKKKQVATPVTNNRFNQYPQRQYSKEEFAALEQQLLARGRRNS